MKNYIFNTQTTMKEYNNKKWLIDPHIIRTVRVSAENLNEGLSKYRDIVNNGHYGITISKNALKTKSPMYVETIAGTSKQVGFVITGLTLMENGSYQWVQQYVDLWVEILTVVDTDF